MLTRPDAQLVLLDTPGLSKPRTTMARRMNALVRDSLSTVDVVAFLVDAESGVGSGDEFLAAELASLPTPIVTVVNKIDALGGDERLMPVLERVARMTAARPFADVVPVSALEGANTDRLIDVLARHLPEAPRLFASDRVSDQPETLLAAEILREKIIADLADELPHSVAVTVDEITEDERSADLVHIDAVIHVERDSQKGIIIGRGGLRLKEAATARDSSSRRCSPAGSTCPRTSRSRRTGSETRGSSVGSGLSGDGPPTLRGARCASRDEGAAASERPGAQGRARTSCARSRMSGRSGRRSRFAYARDMRWLLRKVALLRSSTSQ